ncbi:hypothetical protein ACE7GA_26675 (plasmid) [Roseomonas sp. CCTCC AB2023176]|uniref:hypothetical protein n=1 Tax=Roseomonas sp. CCTCC AB2023176 TaxID=3342640 RepID=UPI0035DFF402
MLAEELTGSDVHDTVPVPAMLDRITNRIGRVYGDAAYAGGPTYCAVVEHREALPNAEGVFRPKAPDVTRGMDSTSWAAGVRHARHGAHEGRRAWEKATGYGRRNAAEWTHSRRKGGLGPGRPTATQD